MENFQPVSYEKKSVPQDVKIINFIILISIISYLCFSFGIALVQEILSTQLPWLKSVAVSAVVGELGMVLPAIIYLGYKKVNWSKQLRFHKIKISTVLLLIIFAYAIMPLMNFLSAVTMLFSKNIRADTLNQVTGNHSSITALVVIALIPGLLEEFLYRGVVYGIYEKNNERFGIILSGLLFGLVHMNVNQFVYAFVMGIMFALLVKATDSLFSSMIVHFVINGTSVVLQYASQKAGGLGNDTEAMAVYSDTTLLLMAAAVWGFIAMLTTVAAVLIYYAIARNEGKIQDIKAIWGKGKGTKLVTIPLIITMLICIAFMWQLSF